MKKNYLLCIAFFFCYTSMFSQCNLSGDNNDPVCRAVLAGVIFETLYFENTDVYDYEASSFPNPFIDLQTSPDLPDSTNELYTKLKVLSYLAYDNGVTVYNYTNEPSACFKPFSLITGIEALIYIMEAWNIEPDSSENDIVSAYVNRAIDENLLNNVSNFELLGSITNGQVVQIISNVLNSSFHPVNEDLNDIDNYFIPGIYTPYNLSQSRGLNQGVFNHYAKDSFVIPDIKMSLNFSHFYSTTLVELPEDFYPVKPLGRGWSHTYNSYIIRENNVGFEEIDYYFIVQPDGTIHVYNEDDNEYESIGVYDELDDDLSNDRIRIRKKNQMDYYYQQIDSDQPIWYLIEIEDPNNNEINIEYENSDVDQDFMRIEYVESPSGKRLEFEYDNGTDYIERITDPIGREITFDLDPDDDNRLEEFVDAKGNETEYKYVENDAEAPFGDQIKRFLMDEIELPRGNRIRAEYDEDNAKLTSYQIDNDDPIMIDVDYDYEGGEMNVMVTTPTPDNGELNEMYEFNMNGLVVDYESEIDDLNVEYPSSGPNVTLPNNSNLNGVQIDYDYDNRGNVTEINKENGDVVEEMTYSNDNELLSYTDPNGNQTNFTYDNDRNLLQIQDPEGGVTSMNYDGFGQMLSRTNQTGITVNYTYESDGAVSSMTAPEGITANYSYDGINRLVQADNSGLVSFYEYDNNDNITSMTNSGGFTTSYDYDANDNVMAITNPNNIATSFEYDDEDRPITETFGNLVKTYEYNDEGYLDQYNKPSGDQVNYDYDDNGRVTETGTITNITYDNDNLVESITNDTGTIEFDYDNLNRVETVTTVNGYTVEYDWEDSGHLEEIEYPIINGIDLEVNYSYDDKNRVFQVILIRNVGNDGEVIVEYDYLNDDRIEEMNYGNDVRTIYNYDNAGRKDYIEHVAVGNGNTFYQHINELDNRGNIIETFEFARPIENQITPETINTGYNYDDNSHIQNAGNIDYNVNSDGNTSSASSSFSAQYDIDDRLTNYSDLDNNTSFEYNPYDQRVSVTRSGVTTRFIRDVLNDNILVELQGNTPLYYYIYHPDGMLLARMRPNGDIQYYHGDIRGSVTAMTDEDANITHLYRYDDFGSVTGYTEPNNESNRFKYVGMYGVETDTDDLYYMRARYYRPTIGRFLTEDPIWSTNLYPYADNNPISKIDPLGKMGESYDSNRGLFDVTSIGVSASAVALGGFSLGLNANFINYGEHASKCPILTGSFGLDAGASLSADISVGGYIYSGEGDFQPEYLNSNLFDDNVHVNADVLVGGLNGSYEKVKEGSLTGIFGSIGLGFGGTVGTRGTRTLLDTNKIFKFLGYEHICQY